MDKDFREELQSLRQAVALLRVQILELRGEGLDKRRQVESLSFAESTPEADE